MVTLRYSDNKAVRRHLNKLYKKRKGGEDMKSKKYSLNSEDIKSISRGLIIALVGAGLTYLSQVVVNVNFSTYTPLVVAGFGVLANIVRKFLVGR